MSIRCLSVLCAASLAIASVGGAAQSLSGQIDLALDDATIAESGRTRFVYRMRTGDLNGDGVADLVAGAPGAQARCMCSPVR